MDNDELKKSCMAFELTDGKVLLIHDDDVKELVNKFWTQMIMDKRTHVYILNDPGLQRARELYKIYQSEKKEMEEDMRKDYLKTILKFLKDSDLELTTLEKLTENQKNNQ